MARTHPLGGSHSLANRRSARAAPAEPREAPVHTAPELDRLIHERIRLGMVSALAANESLSFNELKKLLLTTDGNLSVHARKLEEAKYVLCEKYFEGRWVSNEEYAKLTQPTNTATPATPTKVGSCACQG